MNDVAPTLAAELIASQRTVVLATADPEPWAAPVYYLFRNGRFYFFSSADSRHVAAALASGTCAGSIFRDSDNWREIEGLQMNGRARRSHRRGVEADAAFDGYVKRFPTVREFLTGATLGLDAFLRQFRTRMYSFTPERVHYLNNSGGFGSRAESS